MSKRSERKNLPASVIALAVIGDEKAMRTVFGQYDGLIEYILFKEIKAWNLNSKLMPVEDMQQVRADLVKAIRNFTIRH